MPHRDATQRDRLVVPLLEGVNVGRDRAGDGDDGRDGRQHEVSPELVADEVERAVAVAVAVAPGPPPDRGEAPRPPALRDAPCRNIAAAAAAASLRALGSKQE